MTARLDESSPAVECLWRSTAVPALALPRLTGPIEAEVAIVGAGITGLVTAVGLAERGVATVVLEAAEPGGGASGASGGQVIAGLRHRIEDLTGTYGGEKARELYLFGAQAADRCFELIARFNILCEATRSGWIQLADTEEGLAEAERRVAGWKAAGADVRLLDPGEAEQLTGAAGYRGGWLDSRGGTVQPLSYSRGLARTASMLGARLFTQTPALAIERRGASWRVATPGGSVTACKLLIATNALTGALWPGLAQMILPVWSFQLATAPLTGEPRARTLPGRHAVSDTRRVLRYFRVDGAHRLIVGGKGTLHAPRRARDFTFQLATLERLFPALGGARVEHVWGGQVAITRDRLPRLVRVGPDALASFGCNGKGIAWCTAMGGALAQFFGEGRPPPLPVTPVEPIPLYGLSRLYRAAGGAWYRWRDFYDGVS